MMIDSTVNVVAVRVNTTGQRPPRKHRHLRRQQALDDLAQLYDFRFEPGKTLHQRDVAQRVGRALRKVGVMTLDRALQGLGLAHDQRREARENDAQRDQQRSEPPIDKERDRQQDEQRDERGEMIAEEPDPQPPQRVRALQHHLHQPAGMGIAVIGERKLQHVLEIAGQDDVAAAMREAVRVKSDQRAADDGEKPEAGPGGKQHAQS